MINDKSGGANSKSGGVNSGSGGANSKSGGVNSGSGGAHFSVRFQISHRAIKIGAIFIAVMILITLAIPALSADVARSTGYAKISMDGPQMFISPDLVILPDDTVYMGVVQVVNMGVEKIEGNNYAWAIVYLKIPGEVVPPAGGEHLLLHVPAPKMRSLFELSLATGAEIALYGRKIPRPDGLPFTTRVKLYEPTKIKVYPGWDG